MLASPPPNPALLCTDAPYNHPPSSLADAPHILPLPLPHCCRDDIPLSAVDFHTSDMPSFLLQQPKVLERLADMTRGCWWVSSMCWGVLQ